jgi:hypothetical protein
VVNMEEICFSETLVSTYKFKWHYNPEDEHQHYRIQGYQSNKNENGWLSSGL